MTDYAELRANCERITAERHKNPAPYDREAVLARQTLRLLDKLERYEKALEFYAEEDSYIPQKASDGGYDTPVAGDGGYKANHALNPTEANEGHAALREKYGPLRLDGPSSREGSQSRRC